MTSFWPILLVLLVPLPIGTDRRRRNLPWVTWTLIVLNTAVYLGTVLYSRHYSPDGLSLGHDLINGPSDPDLFTSWGFLPATPRLPSLFLSLFLHVSLAHLFWNMAFLWLFGSHVEDALGPLSYLALYLGGGLAAGILHTAIKWLVPAQRYTLEEPLVGASGAISAIVAPFAVRYHRAQIRLLWLPGLLARSDWARLEVPALAGLALWLLQNVVGAVLSLKPGQGRRRLLGAPGRLRLRPGRLGTQRPAARGAAGLSPGRSPRRRGRGRRTHPHRRQEVPRLPGPRPRQRPRPPGTRPRPGPAPRRPGGEPPRGRAGTSVRRARPRQAPPVGRRRALCAEAAALGLPLPLTARERLRLAGAAEEAGEPDTAVRLLRALIPRRRTPPKTRWPASSSASSCCRRSLPRLSPS